MSKDPKWFEPLLHEDWLELESDPGLFTLLIEDFGVQDVAVEEVYDISQKPLAASPVYGFVFLFRWNGKNRRRKANLIQESYVDKSTVVNDMFFAYQMTPNSCATHALLSVLLNCNNVELGPLLTKIKEFCRGLDPECIGYAIASSPSLARSHNRYAYSCIQPTSKKQQARPAFVGRIYEADTFHYVSYVPIGDRLFELDGLKPGPIDHGPWGSHEEWTDLFLRVISDRIDVYSDGNSDIHFSLLAIVIDHLPRLSRELEAYHKIYETHLTETTSLAEKCDISSLQGLCLRDVDVETLKNSASDVERIETVTEAATAWLHLNTSHSTSSILDGDVTGLPCEPLRSLVVTVAKLIQAEKNEERCHKEFLELLETKQRYYKEHVHRSHNHFPVIEQFLAGLSEEKQLCSENLLNHATSFTPCKKRKGSISSTNKTPSKKLRTHLTK